MELPYHQESEKVLVLDHIRIDDAAVEGRVFHLGALIEQLDQLGDHRHSRGKRYPLTYLIGAIVMAKLSGQHRPAASAELERLAALYKVGLLSDKQYEAAKNRLLKDYSQGNTLA